MQVEFDNIQKRREERIRKEEEAKKAAELKDLLEADFEQVQRGGNWAYEDQLRGKCIVPGSYEVRWADGRVTTHPVEVDESSTPASDMGHATRVPVRNAYVLVDYHGTTVEIRSLGLFMRRLPS